MNKQNITALLFIVVFALCNQMFAQMKDTGTYIVYEFANRAESDAYFYAGSRRQSSGNIKD